MIMYSKYTKVIEAEFPRWRPHSTIPSGISLSVVFDHYTLISSRKNTDKVQLNFFFLAGTGMTKSVWNYHIKNLFQYSEENQATLDWQLSNCIAIDQVNHGESAVENAGKLGWEFDWREGAHDLIQVAKSQRLLGINILVGHSMGGFQSLYISTVAPLLFKFTIVIEPITHNHSSQIGIFGKKMIPALAKVIRSDFKDENDFHDYFYNKSFYKRAKKEILDEFVESEKIINRDGSVTAKTSARQQLIVYHSALRLWAETGDFIPKNVRIPVVYIIGENAEWNSKACVQEMLEFIPDVEQVIVPNGQHLVNIEQPDEILEIFIKSLNKRIKRDTEHSSIPLLSKVEYERTFNENYALIDKDIFKKNSKL